MVCTDCTLELRLLALSGILLLMLHMQLSKQFMIPAFPLYPLLSANSVTLRPENEEMSEEEHCESGDSVTEV